MTAERRGVTPAPIEGLSGCQSSYGVQRQSSYESNGVQDHSSYARGAWRLRGEYGRYPVQVQRSLPGGALWQVMLEQVAGPAPESNLPLLAWLACSGQMIPIGVSGTEHI